MLEKAITDLNEIGNELIDYIIVGGVAQWLERRFCPANFPALDLQLMVTTNVCKPSATGQPTRATQPSIPSGSINE